MKTIPSIKIILHWILVVIVSVLLLYYIENKSILCISLCLLIMSLIFNRTVYLILKTDSLLLIKTNFLFIPTFKLSFKIDDIISLSLIDYKYIDISNSRKNVEFEAVVIVEVITGTFFYKPNYKLTIDLTQNKRIELELNSHRKDTLKILTDLQSQIDNRHNV